MLSLVSSISAVLGDAVSYQYHAHNGVGGYSFKFAHPQKYSVPDYHHHIPEVRGSVPEDTVEVKHAKAVHAAAHAKHEEYTSTHHQAPSYASWQEPTHVPVHQQPSEEPSPSVEAWHGSQHVPMAHTTNPHETQQSQDDHAEFRNVADEDGISQSYEFGVFHGFKHVQEAQAVPQHTNNAETPSQEAHEPRNIPEDTPEDNQPNYPENYRYLLIQEPNYDNVPAIQSSPAPGHATNHNQHAQNYHQSGGEPHDHHSTAFGVWHVPASHPMAPAETPEVQKARAAHLAVHAEHQQYHHKQHGQRPKSLYYLPESGETSNDQQQHAQAIHGAHSGYGGWHGQNSQRQSMNMHSMSQENERLEAQHREVVDYNPSVHGIQAGGHQGHQDGGYYSYQWSPYQ
ncbi:histidine-rich glycoprotein-like [Toxorhynchites rutilus septentrionalis]|uniref:histidine-rich glycoprotein-like n=1 Tax=Toxorhynchites rutilus septentrionalis TaxID=329112 RepID=UPI002479C300|nr:histidine-rich glycoprotein-like [Toxorhynchites rutilus septentrionalis]